MIPPTGRTDGRRRRAQPQCRSFPSNDRLLAFALSLALAFGLAGCGNKGPLRLPGSTTGAGAPAPAGPGAPATPAAPRAPPPGAVLPGSSS